MRRCGPVSSSDVGFSSRTVTPSTRARAFTTAIPVTCTSSGATGGGGGGGGAEDEYPPPPQAASCSATTRAAEIDALVRRSILVRHLPLAVDEDGRDVVVGIDDLLARSPVADLEVGHLLVRLVHQPVRVAGAGLEPRAHARSKARAALVRVQRRVSTQDVDELVLLGVRVAQRRLAPGKERGQVDAEVGEPEQVAQRTLVALRHP